jgi:uncharacterized protein (TIGR00255 family)
MVQSMTGYGSASLTTENYKATVEIKSLNSKFVEINLKMPRNYMQQEIVFRNQLTQALQRGKINAVINLEVINPDKLKLHINRPLVMAYNRELELLRQELGLHEPATMEYLLSLPDALISDHDEIDQEELELVQKAFALALDRIVQSRNQEGKALELDMLNCGKSIAVELRKVEEAMPSRIEAIRSRLSGALQEVKERAQLDENRYEQELIYYIEKLDVNEEIVRLSQHIEYFQKTLSEPESNGKKIGFILQEIGREINTIGSKANNAGMQVYVVRMKEDLERIKEQVQNIV